MIIVLYAKKELGTGTMIATPAALTVKDTATVRLLNNVNIRLGNTIETNNTNEKTK